MESVQILRLIIKKIEYAGDGRRGWTRLHLQSECFKSEILSFKVFPHPETNITF